MGWPYRWGFGGIRLETAKSDIEKRPRMALSAEAHDSCVVTFGGACDGYMDFILVCCATLKAGFGQKLAYRVRDQYHGCTMEWPWSKTSYLCTEVSTACSI